MIPWLTHDPAVMQPVKYSPAHQPMSHLQPLAPQYTVEYTLRGCDQQGHHHKAPHTLPSSIYDGRHPRICTDVSSDSWASDRCMYIRYPECWGDRWAIITSSTPRYPAPLPPHIVSLYRWMEEWQRGAHCHTYSTCASPGTLFYIPHIAPHACKRTKETT